MKKSKIKDKIFIPMIIIFVIIGLVISILASVRYKDNQQLLKEDFFQMVEKCKTLKEEEARDGEMEWCQKIIEDDLSEFDTNAYDAYDYYSMDYLTMYLNEFILIAIIVVGSSYYITKYLRNRIILNNITREKYKIIIKKLFFSAWKYAILISVMLVTIYFVIFLNVDKFYFTGTEYVGTIFENNIILLFFMIIVKSFILSLFYININLIISRKEHNYILSVIKTYLLIVGIEIFLEIAFGNFIDTEYDMLFNIINIYTYPYAEYGLTQVFILSGILIVSFIPLYFSYRNKEKLIIDVEKNDNKEEV